MTKFKLTSQEIESINSILIIQTAFIGDAILSTPIFREIKKIFPNSKVDILAIPQTSNLFIHNPNIHQVIEFDKRKLSDRVKSIFNVLKIIRINKYDLAISVQSSFTSSMLMILGRINLRIGYPRQKLLTHTIKIIKGLHVRKRVLRLLEPITDKELNDKTELFWNDKESHKIDKIFNSTLEKKSIVVAPGSAQFTKQWPKEYFSELIKKLSKDKIEIYLVGGNDDREVCDFIESQNPKEIFNLCGELTLLESAALIEKVDLVLSNDSAPMHIANAVETDVIGIFGPTVKSFGFYPYRENDKIMEIDLDCRPCGKHGGDKCPLGHFKCMMDILPKSVYKVISSKLDEN